MFLFTAIKSVRRGAAFLDKERPGWADKINVPRLDIGSPSDCIVGQLHGGDFCAGLLTLKVDDTESLGFMATSEGDRTIDFENLWLTLLWKIKVIWRQEDPVEA